MAGPSGANTLVNIARETTWGTAPAGGWHQIAVYSLDFRPREPFINDPMIGQGRERQDPQRDPLDCTPTVEVPIDLRCSGYWLTALLGLPVTTGTGPYTHVWKSGGTLASFSIEMVVPGAGPRFFRAVGFKANTFSVSISPRGRAAMRFDGVAKDYVESGTTAAGTPVVTAISPFSQYQGTLTRDGSALARVTAAEFRYGNNLESDRYVGGGGALGDLIENDAAFDGSITGRPVDATFFDWGTLRQSGDLAMAYVSGANSLTFDGKRVWLERAGLPATNPRAMSSQFSLVGSKDATAGAALVVTLVNDVTGYTA